MKVLVLPSWYPPNGGMFFAHQTQWLMEAGITAAIINIEEKSLINIRLEKIVDDLRVRRKYEFGIYTYWKTQLRVPKLNRINAWLWIKTAIFVTEKFIAEQGKPDLIQAHSCMWGGYVAGVIKKRYGIPYVITEHRGRFNEKNFYKQQEINSWHYPLLKSALIGASAIIPVSEKMVSVLEDIAGRKLPCKPIPNPVNENIFKPGEGLKNNIEDTVFLSITNFQPYKAIDVLIKAFYLASQKQSNIYLHIAGEGPDRRDYIALAENYKLNEKIFFDGQKTQLEIKELINACDFLVLSSHNEGQPVSIGESALCGKPVICTNVVSETDVPDFAGFITETGNPASLANAMLIGHNRKKDFNTDKIRTHALERFSRKVVMAEITEVMTNVILSNV